MYVSTNEQEEKLIVKVKKFCKTEYFDICLVLLATHTAYLKLGMLFPFTKFVGCFIRSMSFASKIFDAAEVGLVKLSSPVSRLRWLSWK